MGTYDISRVAFDPRKHYSSVRMQQGRVLTDDDWNENERIENEERRRSRIDIIGPCGSPDRGFKIENPRIVGGLIEFDIHNGIFHLGGLRLEMELAQRAIPPTYESYRTQKDWLQQLVNVNPSPALATGQERFDLVYLEAWQQAVSAVEDEELFEVALGGPDTTTRMRNMRRVRMLPGVGFRDCARAWQRLTEFWDNNNIGHLNRGHELIPNVSLQVGYDVSGVSDDLCSPSITGGYLGAENQAIRVQIIDNAHLTWGFDNASPLYRVTASGTSITLLTEPKDEHHWPLSGQVVEILPWSAVLPNGEKVATKQGHLTTVDTSYDPDTGELTITTGLPLGFGEAWKSRSDAADIPGRNNAEYFYLRVWDRGADLSSPAAVPFTPGTPVLLGQTGIEVTLSGTDYLPADHWVIAARPETPDEVLPWRLEAGMPPQGCRRYFAPLAIIRWSQDAAGSVVGEVIRDCRKTFRPLTDLETCCTFSVGDGLNSRGDFDSIEEAVQNLPEEGGKICVLPGEHVANVELFNRSHIRISGCGEHTIVRPRQGRVSEPIFRIRGSQRIQIDHLSLISVAGTAIIVEDTPDVIRPSQEITIDHNRILACVNAIHIRVRDDVAGDNQINISYNHIGMIDKEGGDVAIFCIADGVLIERNHLVVVPAPDPDDPNDPRDPNDPGGGVFDPCADQDQFYLPGFRIWLFVYLMFLYINALLNSPKRYLYQTKGGIQIGGTSERVRILENKIIGGNGNGVTLGHLPAIDVNIQAAGDSNYDYSQGGTMIDSYANPDVQNVVEENFNNTLYEISIENNLIQKMGLSGVGVVSFFDRTTIGLMVSVENLTIYRNVINLCAQQIPVEIPANMLAQVGFGGVGLADVTDASIQENRIEDNGFSHLEPVCGVFIANGEQIDVTNNQILNNGPRISENDVNMRMGQRGGIIVKNSFKLFAKLESSGIRPMMFDNTFAVKVHSNIVIQPVGHALALVAFGPVSVVDNQMTTQGINQSDPLAILAGSVFIFNLGISKDLLFLTALRSLKGLASNQTYGYNNGASPTLTDEQIQAINFIQYLPSGKVLFSDNQVMMDQTSTASSFVLSSQLIVSLDDIAYNSNQAECNGFIGLATSTFDIVLTDVLLLSFSIRSSDNRFQEGFSFAIFSLISYGLVNTAIGNQASHCMLVYGSLTPPPALFQASNMIIAPNNFCETDRDSYGKNVFGI